MFKKLSITIKLVRPANFCRSPFWKFLLNKAYNVGLQNCGRPQPQTIPKSFKLTYPHPQT